MIVVKIYEAVFTEWNESVLCLDSDKKIDARPSLKALSF